MTPAEQRAEAPAAPEERRPVGTLAWAAFRPDGTLQVITTTRSEPLAWGNVCFDERSTERQLRAAGWTVRRVRIVKEPEQ